MRVLALSTIGQACEAGVFDAQTNLSHIVETMSKGHDVRLAICTQKAVNDAGVTYDDIGSIVVIAGPGSFTGVRVGVAFARGLGLALDIPVIGVSSLEASLPLGSSESTLIALPAKRRLPDLSWWVQSFANGIKNAEPEEANVARLLELSAKHDQIFGLGLESIEGIEFSEADMKLENAVRIAADMSNADSFSANPQYVRAPDAVPMAPKK